MKTVAPHDRPREKLQRLGAPALGDNELLAIVLGQGRARASALDLANILLVRAGGTGGLARVRCEDLMRISGIGAARAAQVLAAVELGRRTLSRGRERVQIRGPGQIAEILLPQYGGRSVEQFGVMLLDTRHRLLRTAILSIGSLDASVVQPRDVFREALAAGAAALVLFHNHPSGDPEPSTDDIRLTRRLVAGGILMGVDVIDHIVLGDVKYCSLRERGFI